ncbi:MAG: hypothetical protein OEZ39_16220 [Gammaproteobacteria bacterium]|nr:hypothetical protein [Gammaproteobacteria bacterium]MDH5653405.1 hypothetical protein [Gammaproteobacteria bacterium]
MEYIAERRLQGIDNKGRQIDIVVGIGAPYEDKNMESWACPVKIEGLHRSLADQHGIDAWQAIRLSQKLVVGLLSDFIEKGGKLYIFDEEDELKKNEIEEFF